ncbi:MAG: VWA domain-containing protein [Acidobacteria bacterium]|nr:VWA domain-containing protein [Acidobacteriota bacterium]
MPSSRLYRQRLAAALLAALCLPARAQDAARPQPSPAPPARQVPAQPQPSPATDKVKDEEEVVRISTELVQTDVMVFDKSGKFVEGLGPEQFELKVDGKPQQIAFFERVRAGTVDEDAQIAAARGGSVIFFVDDLHLSAGSTSHIRKTLLRFVEDEIGQNDEAAVVSASGQVGFLQQLTDNKAVLRAAAGRVNTRPYAVRDGQSPLMTEVHAVAIERGDTQVLDYFVEQTIRENPMLRREMVESMVQNRARVIVQQARAIARNTLGSLESVVRGYAQLPGRKIVFFISDGFIVDDGDTTLRDRMRIISDAAARAGVVIYSLDAMGLRTGQADASTRGNFDPTGQLSRIDMSEGSAMQEPLFHLAAETGGRALINTNALGRVVSGALKETSVYYLFAWRPDLTSGGGAAAPKYRRIEVSVAGRPDLRVMVRRGFYSAEPVEEAPRADKKKSSDNKTDGDARKGGGQQASPGERDLLEALRAPLPRASLPTSLAVGYVQGEKAVSVLTVSVELEREALTFAQGERPRAEFDVIGAVLDDRGKNVAQFGQRLSVTANPSVPASEQHIIYSFSLALQPGLYQVRAATRDSGSGRTGSAMQWVEVPELTKQFSMSSLYIGERPAGQSAASLKPEDIPRSVLLSVDRRFARTSFIRFLTYVYNPAAGTSSPPDVALQVQIFRDDQPVFTAPLIKLNPSGDAGHSTLPYMAELSLSSFPPGRYVFQVTAIDRAGKTSTARRARFVIE